MITDWDDAYENSAYIPDADSYPGRWAEQAAAFRVRLTEAGRADLNVSYGAGVRQSLDILRPAGTPQGLAVFIHGGYWMRFHRSDWSHLAEGALARGWAVALPSYTLAPDVRISQITREIGAALAVAAARVPGPIRIAGHSAGGHLAARMISKSAPAPMEARRRIRRVVSISGAHDLRPLLRTARNKILRLSESEAASESPALLRPMPGARLVCWVGSEERPEFLRQNDLLANIWTGLGAEAVAYRRPGRHHFDVIEDLRDPGSALMDALLG